MEIPITRVVFGDEEMDAVRRPLESGWVVQGPWVRAFEAEFARFAASRYAIATTSCTTALHVCVAALGLKQGDEVIVPAFTWVSTPNVVEYMGAQPVFCDIDLATFNVDVAKIEERITARTVGLLPVHLFGLAAEMEPILEIARRRGLWVVEDAACALGATYGGRHVGTMGDAGCFSFHPRKAITTGEGGMVTTDRDDIERAARSLRDHGATRSDRERHVAEGAYLLADYPVLGYNYRMTDIQGALGCAQMKRAASVLGARAARAVRYDERLAKLDWLERPVVPAGRTHGYQAYVTLFRPEQPVLGNADRLHGMRNALMATLESKGIATRQGTHAPVLQKFYAERYDLRREMYPNATLADLLSLTLPLYPQMTDEEQDRVIEELDAAYRRL